MQPILEVTLDAMRQDAARLERVATNLANVSTPGYKREIWMQAGSTARSGEFSELVEAGTRTAADPPRVTPGPAEVGRDLRPGTIKPTGQPLDLALLGPGFFEVATEHGPAYTRHGQFRLDGSGRIVTAQGHALLGKSGELTLTSLDLSIDGSGRIHQGGRVVDQIKVVQFAANTRLSAQGAGLFTTDGSAHPVEDAAIKLRQGHLENANVDTAHEMVMLMQTMRHFESMQRVAQGYDDMLGSAIRKLGDL